MQLSFPSLSSNDHLHYISTCCWNMFDTNISQYRMIYTIIQSSGNTIQVQMFYVFRGPPRMYITILLIMCIYIHSMTKFKLLHVLCTHIYFYMLSIMHSPSCTHDYHIYFIRTFFSLKMFNQSSQTNKRCPMFDCKLFSNIS